MSFGCIGAIGLAGSITLLTGLSSKPALAEAPFSQVQQRIEHLRRKHNIPGASARAGLEDNPVKRVMDPARPIAPMHPKDMDGAFN